MTNKRNNLPPLGVQSYCFHRLNSLDKIWESCLEAGIEAIEYWPHHILYHDDDLDNKTQAVLNAPIKPSSYGLAVISADEEDMHGLFQFAKRLGISAMTAMVAPDNYEIADRFSEQYGIKLAIHNHGVNCPYGTFDKIDCMLDNSKTLGLCLDTGWMMQAGHCPLEALDRYKESIYGIHLKDFIFSEDGQEDVLIGEGQLDFEASMAKILELPNLTYLSLEYEGAPENPLPVLKEAVKKMRPYYA